MFLRLFVITLNGHAFHLLKCLLSTLNVYVHKIYELLYICNVLNRCMSS